MEQNNVLWFNKNYFQNHELKTPLYVFLNNLIMVLVNTSFPALIRLWIVSFLVSSFSFFVFFIFSLFLWITEYAELYVSFGILGGVDLCASLSQRYHRGGTTKPWYSWILLPKAWSSALYGIRFLPQFLPPSRVHRQIKHGSNFRSPQGRPSSSSAPVVPWLLYSGLIFFPSWQMGFLILELFISKFQNGFLCFFNLGILFSL